MKAIIKFELEITDYDFESKEEKKLFMEATEEQRQSWLKEKAEELKNEAEIKIPIIYEL